MGRFNKSAPFKKMPYIKSNERQAFQDLINLGVDKLKDLNVGNINYVISSIIWKLFESKKSYKTANDIVGVLECIKQEFYRRKIEILEDSKIILNGDI